MVNLMHSMRYHSCSINMCSKFRVLIDRPWVPNPVSNHQTHGQNDPRKIVSKVAYHMISIVQRCNCKCRIHDKNTKLNARLGFHNMCETVLDVSSRRLCVPLQVQVWRGRSSIGPLSLIPPSSSHPSSNLLIPCCKLPTPPDPSHQPQIYTHTLTPRQAPPTVPGLHNPSLN